MARPKKDIVVKKNGESFQVYEDNNYIGSVSREELCLFVEAKKSISTKELRAQLYFIKNGKDPRGLRTEG